MGVVRTQRSRRLARGLCLAGGRLWIANTNLHEIVCVDLASGVARRVPVAEA